MYIFQYYRGNDLYAMMYDRVYLDYVTRLRAVFYQKGVIQGAKE